MSVQAVAVQGVLLQTGNGSSPETFLTIANVEKFTMPGKTKTVDVSNVSNLWQIWVPTLLMAGECQLDVYWVMSDPSHNSSSPYGLRYLWQNKILKDFKITYNDGNNSTDSFQAYVTTFSITGQEADVFKATVTLTINSQPSLV